MKLRVLGAVILLIGPLTLSISYAATVPYYDETSFQLALDTYTLVNLDAAPFNTFGDPYNVQDAGPAAAFLAAGISGFDANHQVEAGNDIQMLKPDRDRLLLNGNGFGVGDMVISFAAPVNGIGAWTNDHPTFGPDGGEIIAYDSDGLEIGRVAFGQSPAAEGGFSGLISDQAIASAKITCTFNGDLKCGVYDIQFGTSIIPIPPALYLFGSGLIGLLGMARRKNGLINSDGGLRVAVSASAKDA
jgi:hypothetical protein